MILARMPRQIIIIIKLEMEAYGPTARTIL